MENDFATLDKINLFYVAMTRPKERLHLLVDTYHPPKNKSSESNAFKFNKLVDDFIGNSAIKETGLQTYQYGAINQKQEVSKNNKNTNLIITALKHEDWKKHIQMSLDTDELKMAAADWGSKVHQFFSKIKSEEDIEKHLAQSRIMLQLSDIELEDLVQKAKQVLEHPELRELYKSGNLILNEREFYTSDQKILRPDRIIKKEDHIYILDYKTGKPSQKDEQQIMQYCNELERLSSLEVTGYLVYLHDRIIVKSIKY
jgi:ATP-dependent exoDNAse (exonuclease V) beta subunit